MWLRFRARVAKLKPTYLRMILGLAVLSITIVVYTNSALQSTMHYFKYGDISVNIAATSFHKSHDTTKDDTQQTVINYVSKWQPVVLHNISANLFSNDNTTAVPSQNNNEIKLKRKSQTVNARPMTHNGDKKKIIVLTTKRSGSSFIGRILFEHPDIYYFFEPLQIVMHNNNILDNNDKLNSFVQKLFSCAFTDALYDAEVLPSHHRYLTYRPCTTFLRYIDPRHGNSCRLTDIARIEVICRQARYVAMKVIRLYPSQLALIKKYLKEEVQIIHLNRDPRGVISSRIMLEKGKLQLSTYIHLNFDRLVKKASNHCTRIRDTVTRLALWTADEPSFIKFYHLIRYEDFAYHPRSMSKYLFWNIGLKLHRNVTEWLRNATTSSKPGSKKFSVIRNSTATAEAWRNKLPFHFVRAMQGLPDCQFVMRRLGYEFAETETMLLNKSVSLVLKL